MRDVGSFLKEARVKKKYSLDKLEEETKIKRSFLESIEESKWDKLPALSVVMGFVKSIASTLSVDPSTAVALLKRDYPPRALPINPKPDVSSEFIWSPRFTFLVGVGIVILVILGYLGVQFVRFSSPPPLEVAEPKEGQTVTELRLKILGKTDPEATVKANNQPLLVDEKGIFEGEIELTQESKEVKITTSSRSGKETSISRTIKVELNQK